MITTEKCSYIQTELKKKRKELKERGYVSSVAIAGMLNCHIEIVDRRRLFEDMKKVVQKSESVHGILLDIFGTTKMYYKENEWKEIIEMANEYRRYKNAI